MSGEELNNRVRRLGFEKFLAVWESESREFTGYFDPGNHPVRGSMALRIERASKFSNEETTLHAGWLVLPESWGVSNPSWEGRLRLMDEIGLELEVPIELRSAEKILEPVYRRGLRTVWLAEWRSRGRPAWINKPNHQHANSKGTDV